MTPRQKYEERSRRYVQAFITWLLARKGDDDIGALATDLTAICNPTKINSGSELRRYVNDYDVLAQAVKEWCRSDSYVNPFAVPGRARIVDIEIARRLRRARRDANETTLDELSASTGRYGV